jgi:hypothetical protein
MSIDVRWYDESKTALLVIYGKQFELNEFYVTIDTSYQMMESVDCIVDIVQDVTALSRLPPSILSISRYAEGKSHPRRGASIIVGMNRFARIMLNAASNIAPKVTANYYYVSTMKEAHDLLLSLRQARDEQTKE